MLLQELDLTYIYEIGTFIGIAFFILCFILIEKIIKLFPGGKIVKKWRVMQLLLILFSVIYIVDWFFWIYDFHNALFIIGGIIRISTGILIALIIRLFYKTYKIILHDTTS